MQRLRIASIIVASVYSTVALAQVSPNATPSFRAEGVYDFGAIDEVSIFSGGLGLTIPLGLTYPAGGSMSWGLALRYSSSLWESRIVGCGDPDCPRVEMVPKHQFNAGLGWRLNLPALIGPSLYNGAQRRIYVSANGGEHVMYDTLHGQDPDEAVDVGTAAFDQTYLYSRDGSYLRMISLGDTIEVELPNGHVHTFVAETPGGDDHRLTEMRDAYGNGVTVTYETSPEAWVLSDGFRTARIEFTAGRITTVSVPNPEPGAAVHADYELSYSQQSINKPGQSTHGPSTVLVDLLTEIALPDGPTDNGVYSIPAGSYHSQGVIQQLQLPTKGYLSWEWVNRVFPTFRTLQPNSPDNEEPDPFTNNLAVSQRLQWDHGEDPSLPASTPLGTWTYGAPVYTPTLTEPDPADIPEEMVVRVTEPLGHYTEHYFSAWAANFGLAYNNSSGAELWEYSMPYSRLQPVDSGLGGDRYLSTKVYDASDTLLRSTYVRFDTDGEPTFNDNTGSVFNTNRRTVSERTYFHDDGGRWKATTRSDFDGVGHYRSETMESDFGPEKSMITDYNPDQGTYDPMNYPGTYVPPGPGDDWIHSTFASQRAAQDSSPVIFADYCWDGGGQLARVRRRANSSGTQGGTPAPETRDQVVLYDIDSGTGHVLGEQYYGGDLSLSAGTGGGSAFCSFDYGPLTADYELSHTYAFGVRNSTGYAGVPWLALDLDISQRSGLVEAGRTPDGVETGYTYDALSRLRAIDPGSDGDTEIDYLTATVADRAKVIVRELMGGSGSAEDDRRELEYDGLGRLAVETETLPGDSMEFEASRVHAYNGNGWKASVSGLGFPNELTTFDSYDPFGRVTSTTLPDGHVIQDEYDGERRHRRTTSIGTVTPTLATGETTTSLEFTDSFFDAWGRLIQVDEPSAATHKSTTYQYDSANRLVNASVDGQGRSFYYDGRGLLINETHPEHGGPAVDFRYDARGNPRTRELAGSVLCFELNFAEQVEDVWGDTGVTTSWCAAPDRKLKEFVYQGTTGRLLSATRTNYVQSPVDGSNLTIDVQQDFFYDSRGRVDERATSAAPNGTVRTFRQFWTYDTRGRVDALTQPACYEADNAVGFGCVDKGGEVVRIVEPDYFSGQLRGLPGIVDQIDYNPNGLPSRIVYVDGSIDYQDVASHGMQRPSALLFEDATSAPQRLFQYQYDGAGNILGDGDYSYVYDGVSRLTEVVEVVESDGSPSAINPIEDHSYDPLGNKLSLPTNVGVDTTTNRLQGQSGFQVSYDTRGNLTRYGENHFFWDELDQMVGSSTTSTIGSGGTSRLNLYDTEGERVFVWQYSGPEIEIKRWELRDHSGKILRAYDVDAFVDRWIFSDFFYRGTLLAGIDVPPSEAFNPPLGIFSDGFESGDTTAWTSGGGGGGVTRIHQVPHLDHLGSPRMFTESGVTVAAQNFLVFGEEVVPVGEAPLRTRMKFTGHERDRNDESMLIDLDYMHARYCDPIVGRFLSVDPDPDSIVRSMPQSWNRFTEVLNNPLVFVDPHGEKWFPTGDGGWQFLEGVDSMQVAVSDENMAIRIETEQGIDSLVTFNGQFLTLRQPNGSTRTFPAVAGNASTLDIHGRSNGGLQDVQDVGPLPEGEYYFRPSEIQTITLAQEAIGALGRGAWPGGSGSWGEQRVWLTPAAGTEMHGRSGFTIHGGDSPGSRGCIDLCQRGKDFFRAVDRSVAKIPVYVSYPD